MAKRGRPRKADSELKRPRRHKPEDTLPSTQDSSVSFNMEDREALYARADEVNRPENETTYETVTTPEEVVEEVVEEHTETTPEEVVEEATTETVETDTSTDETEETGYETEADDKKIVEVPTSEESVKTVPHGAFHEEREKRKEYQRRYDEAQEREKQLIEDNRKLMDRVQVEEDDGTDPEIRQLKAELQELKARTETREYEENRNAQQRDIETVDSALKSRGIMGFKEIGKDIVTRRLNDMYAEDPAYAVAHDNPEGWQKIYEEELPNIQKVFAGSDKQTTLDKALERKKQAGLVTKAGTPSTESSPKSKKTEYELYVEEREKLNL